MITCGVRDDSSTAASKLQLKLRLLQLAVDRPTEITAFADKLLQQYNNSYNVIYRYNNNIISVRRRVCTRRSAVYDVKKPTWKKKRKFFFFFGNVHETLYRPVCVIREYRTPIEHRRNTIIYGLRCSTYFTSAHRPQHAKHSGEEFNGRTGKTVFYSHSARRLANRNRYHRTWRHYGNQRRRRRRSFCTGYFPSLRSHTCRPFRTSANLGGGGTRIKWSYLHVIIVVVCVCVCHGRPFFPAVYTPYTFSCKLCVFFYFFCYYSAIIVWIPR